MTVKAAKAFGAALITALSLWSVQAFALDPSLDVSQYGHTAWRFREGFAKGTVNKFAQTPDGYLWLGSTLGLMRFDGVRLVPWQSLSGETLPSNWIRSLLVAHDGTLWIGTLGGLASWKQGILTKVPRFEGLTVDSLVEDREGTIWVSITVIAPKPGLVCAMRGEATECSGEDGRFGSFPGTLYEDDKGSLWAYSQTGLWRIRPDTPERFAGGFVSSQALSSWSNALVFTTNDGVVQLVDEKPKEIPLPGIPTTRPRVLLGDRSGALWIGTDRGLVHLHNGRVDTFDRTDGLSGSRVLKLFEDREGNVWVATDEGVDRFRALPAVTYSAKQGIDGVMASVLADRDGSVWIGSSQGLYQWREGRILAYRAQGARASPRASWVPLNASLFRDRSGRIWLGASNGFGFLQNNQITQIASIPDGFIDVLDEDNEGNLWVLHRNAGLLRVSPDRRVETVRWNDGGRAAEVRRMASDPRGGVWLGFLLGGIVHVANGAVQASYSAADGLGKGFISDIRIAADGAVWVSTDSGLSRVKNGRVATLSSKEGLPCDAIHAATEGDDDAVWLYSTCGLVRISRQDFDVWAAAADQGKAPPFVHAIVLDDSDGTSSVVTPIGSASPHLTKTADGKLWFIAADGVTVVDPKALAVNTLPPPVHVEQITADGMSFTAHRDLRLPPLVRDLIIDYTALSLSVPEKVRFRYRLEGQDADWKEVVNERKVQYSNLPPGDYRFRVIAANNSGIWNEEGDTLAFSIAPAYWQTNWFLALCAVVFAALVLSAYQLRVRAIAHAAALAQQRQNELAHANRLATIGQLTASIAHEVNQPLASAVTNAAAGLRWLKANPPNLEEVSQAFDRIVKDGTRGGDIVSRIRRMVKKAPAEEGDVSINEEIEGIAAITRGEATKHGVSVRTLLASHLPSIKGDRVQLQQVLLNLVVNAIEAMSIMPKAERDLVIMSESDGGDGVLVSVRDTGPGLATDVLEKIFQPFYSSKETGLGMGLSICRSIVEAHNGRLWASANSPRGAIFQFTLPNQSK